MLAQIIRYFQTSSAEYWGYVGQHLFLSLTSLIIAMLIAFPLGYLGSRNNAVAAFARPLVNYLELFQVWHCSLS